MRSVMLTLLATILATPALAQTENAGPPPPQTAKQVAQMPLEVRDANAKIVILPTEGQSSESITGTYEQETLGLAGGMVRGAEIGRVPVEVGHVPINIPIPILREIGMIVGGLTGARQRTVQDMRDRMVEDIARQVDQPLSNVALATDVFWGLREASSVDPKLFAVTTPIPEDTDAILFIHIENVTLNVQEDEVIVATSAVARLQKYSDGSTLYRTAATYEDRDELKNWAKDDYALWREYRVFARHYLTRELVAALYDRVAVKQEIAPASHPSLKPNKKYEWHWTTKALQPTLAWDYSLAADNDFVNGAAITWDVELYDSQKPVYRAQGLTSNQFTLDVPLEACTTYRWTVRPVFTKDGIRRAGLWMRHHGSVARGNGNIGRSISNAHAYIQDFPVVEVHCKAK